MWGVFNARQMLKCCNKSLIYVFFVEGKTRWLTYSNHSQMIFQVNQLQWLLTGKELCGLLWQLLKILVSAFWAQLWWISPVRMHRTKAVHVENFWGNVLTYQVMVRFGFDSDWMSQSHWNTFSVFDGRSLFLCHCKYCESYQSLRSVIVV